MSTQPAASLGATSFAAAQSEAAGSLASSFAITHFQALDSLRGIAALLVAIYHANWVSAVSHWHFVHNAPLMVDLFFVLSGFVICYSYGNRLSSGRDVGRFMWVRFGRVYPLHLALLLLFALFQLNRMWKGLPLAPGNSVHTFVSNLFLLHSMGLHDALSFNYPSWSISVEFYAYVLFAAVAVLAGTGKARVVVSAALVAIGLAVLLWAAQMPPEHAGFDFGYFRCLAGFFTGVLVYHAYLALRAGSVAGSGFVRFGVLGVLVAVLLFQSLRLPETLYGYFLLPLFALLILGLTLTPASRLSALLTTRPLLWLGRVSYSIYMVHAALILVGSGFVRKAFHAEMARLPGVDHPVIMTTPVQGTVALVVYIGVLLVLSQVTFALIEEPFRIRAKRAADRWFSRAPAPAPVQPGA